MRDCGGTDTDEESQPRLQPCPGQCPTVSRTHYRLLRSLYDNSNDNNNNNNNNNNKGSVSCLYWPAESCHRARRRSGTTFWLRRHFVVFGYGSCSLRDRRLGLGSRPARRETAVITAVSGQLSCLDLCVRPPPVHGNRYHDLADEGVYVDPSVLGFGRPLLLGNRRLEGMKDAQPNRSVVEGVDTVCDVPCCQVLEGRRQALAVALAQELRRVRHTGLGPRSASGHDCEITHAHQEPRGTACSGASR